MVHPTFKGSSCDGGKKIDHKPIGGPNLLECDPRALRHIISNYYIVKLLYGQALFSIESDHNHKSRPPSWSRHFVFL